MSNPFPQGSGPKVRDETESEGVKRARERDEGWTRQKEAAGVAGGRVGGRQLTRDNAPETEPEWTSAGHSNLDQRLSPPVSAGPTYRQARAQAQAPGSLSRSGSRSGSESGTPEGVACNHGAPAVLPGPGAAIRPVAARSAGGTRGPLPTLPPSLPCSLQVRPATAGAGLPPGLAAQGPLRGPAVAPGHGDSPRRQPRAAASVPRPNWDRSRGGVRGRGNVIAASAPRNLGSRAPIATLQPETPSPDPRHCVLGQIQTSHPKPRILRNRPPSPSPTLGHRVSAPDCGMPSPSGRPRPSDSGDPSPHPALGPGPISPSVGVPAPAQQGF